MEHNELSNEETDNELMEYFTSGYTDNEKYMRIVPTSAYMESNTRVKWVTLIKTILDATSSERINNHIYYTRKFKNIAVQIFARRQGDILFIEKVKKNEIL